MSDGDPLGLGDLIGSIEETRMDPLVEHPDGYGLYEVVVADDSEPRVVRKYLGRDVIDRAVYLIKGGVSPEDPEDGELDGIWMGVDTEDIHSRFVVTTTENAIKALEGTLDTGKFREVEPDE